MKKLSIFILITILTITVYAQNSMSKTAVNQIIVDTDAIISESSQEDGRHYVMAGLPLHYKLTTVVSHIKRFVNNYSDVSFKEPWIKVDEGLYRCVLLTVDEYLFIYYSESNNVLGFVY